MGSIAWVCMVGWAWVAAPPVGFALGNLNLYVLLIRVPPLLFALTVHEFAHGYVAYLCGDDTAKLQGRLTFNPISHLDPLGALCLLIAPFGWAKPVPVNPLNFRHPRRDDILVSLAGVATNLATAIVIALVMRVVLSTGFHPTAAGTSRAAYTVWTMGEVLCTISIGLMIFNLVPLPPLDGSHVLQHMLPYETARAYARIAPVMSIVLLVLVVMGIFGMFLWPVLQAIVGTLLGDAWIVTNPAPMVLVR